MKRLGRRARLALAVAAPLAVLLAGWLLLVAPQRDEADAIARDTAAAETRYEAQRTAILHGAAPEPIRVADVFRLVEAMPDRQDMPGILLQLEQLARGAGIGFDSIEPQALQPANGYGVQPLELSFSGDYYGLSDFLFRLRNLVRVHQGTLDARGRLFTVEKLTFAQGEPKFPQIDAKIVLDAYVYGTPKQTAKAATG